LHSPIV